MPFAANAAGLGKLTVLSGLGEPLNAEIELLAAGPEELASLTAAIAPEEAYTVQGIERTALHSAIKVELKKKPNGSSLIKLSSVQPITDPFLDMLIQVDWSTGRLLREYTLLLDPPGYNMPPVAAPVTAPTVSTSQPAAPTSTNSSPSADAQPAKKGAAKKSGTPPVSPKPEAAEPVDTKTTVKGDTLYSIAREVQPEGVSLEQVVAGLYRANKGAFIDGNMNRLKVGQIIKVPSSDELTSVPQTEATKQIRVHATDWNAYRNKLASAVAESAPAVDEGSSKAASGGKITTAAEDKAAPAPTGPKDVVKMSKGTPAADTKNLQDKVNSLQEEAIARDKSLHEANDRTAALEKQIADMQKLLAIKNQTMAELQKNATATPPQPAPAPEKPVAEAKPEPAPAPVESPKEASPAPEAATPTPQPEPAPEVKQLPPAEQPKAQKPAAVPVAAPEVSEPSLLDEIDPVIVGGGLAAVLALAGGWLFMRNKRRRNLDGLEKDILTSGGLKANTVFGNTLGGAVGTGDTSFLADFSQSSGMIDAHDVDPIAEAEVYMAYGRDAQAEEILKDAIAKDPKRHELQVKLLEIYASRKDTSAFEALAGELYSTLGSADATWIKVAELGKGLEPNNPLYQVDAAVVAAAGAAAVAATSTLSAGDFTNAEELSDTGTFEAMPETVESSLDFSIGAEPVAETAADEVDSSLDFDLGGESVAATPAEDELIDIAATPVDDVPVEAAIESTADLDFQLDFPSETAESGALDLPEEVAANTMQLDISELSTEVSDSSLDMPDLGFGALEESVAAPSAAEDASTMSFEVDALPELASEPLEAAESLSAVEDISFDLPEVALDEDTDATESVDETIALDLPEFALPDSAEEALTSPVVEELSLPDFDITATDSVEELPDFDKTMIINPEADNEIVFDSVPAEQSTDFDLDLGLGAEEPVVAAPVADLELPTPVKAETEEALPEIDLSGISLDLDTSLSDTDVADIAESESSEVDTKLDLVTAYMDMGDNEGARELLEEVLKEGGEQQRAKAEEILKKLG